VTRTCLGDEKVQNKANFANNCFVFNMLRDVFRSAAAEHSTTHLDTS
jgi:hypothetical protein